MNVSNEEGVGVYNEVAIGARLLRGLSDLAEPSGPQPLRNELQRRFCCRRTLTKGLRLSQGSKRQTSNSDLVTKCSEAILSWDLIARLHISENINANAENDTAPARAQATPLPPPTLDELEDVVVPYGSSARMIRSKGCT
eukprot:CAMPEP_0176418074 /NCGR_PEP_ID=MMETSP0127-20121128/7250_1 /TAXON_ID=938130 /ORGANISM="Platyophrya macrostoma, Strain WH" /LENGTH=139 /DNA_ID=CAMNT_0017798321 /DNA_START=195 /DNA_END=615 /DNA_ORIENTATION=-